MVEMYKVITYYNSFNQIFYDKSKNGSVKGANKTYVWAKFDDKNNWYL